MRPDREAKRFGQRFDRDPWMRGRAKLGVFHLLERVTGTDEKLNVRFRIHAAMVRELSRLFSLPLLPSASAFRLYLGGSRSIPSPSAMRFA